MSAHPASHHQRRLRAGLGVVLAIGIAGSAVVWWRHQQATDARALRISVPVGWSVISTPSAPGPHGLLASMDLEGPHAGSFFVSWTTSQGGIGFNGTATATPVGNREVDVGGRKVTMRTYLYAVAPPHTPRCAWIARRRSRW